MVLFLASARSICSALLLSFLVGLPDITVSLATQYQRPCSRIAISTLPTSRWYYPRISSRVSSPLHQRHVPAAGVEANIIHPKFPGALMHAASSLSNVIRSVTMKWLNILTAAWQRLWSPDKASTRPFHIELTRNIEVVVAEHGQLLDTKRVEEINTTGEPATVGVGAVHHANEQLKPLEDVTRSPTVVTFSPSDAAMTRTDEVSDHGIADRIVPVQELAPAAIEEAAKSAAAVAREPCKVFNLPSAFQTPPLSTWQLPDLSLTKAKALVTSTLNGKDISLESVQSTSVTSVLVVLITQATFSAVLPAVFAWLRFMTPKDGGNGAGLQDPTAPLQQAQALTKTAATVDAAVTVLATAVAQYSVPLRVGFALTIAPWVDVNITKRWLARAEGKGQESQR